MVEGQLTLVLGGARSGKSAVAEQLVDRLAAASALPVTYVATGPADDGRDPDWSARIAAHRARRPATWSTAEVPAAGDLPAVLRSVAGAVLVDSLGTWVAGSDGFAVPADGLCGALVERVATSRPTVVVSDEAGLGVHPSTEAGRLFRDALGEVNQAVSAVAARVLLVVAGRVLELATPGTATPGTATPGTATPGTATPGTASA
jgi:adenosyl cobinamide kinase/adenosyl cobinamide phosphate guanylyltransferase